MTTTNLIIVDDHELFRIGIQSVIKSRYPDINIVGEAQSGAEFFALLKITPVDIVLLDIALPDTSGVDIARQLKREYPNVKILAISADNSASIIDEMLAIGIDGFISKLNSDPDTLVEAIRSVMQGIEYFGSDISSIIRQIYVAKKKTTQITSEFSEQERRIIECSHEGLSVKLIADRLGISINTVNWHKNNIFHKLGINNSLEMVRFAIKNGIIKAKN
ncbi:MAG: response regulator transcription factor [Lentimicrobiaceae bacterium]|nr:response regulator transcription factor [Lentimicrobiaceae bacterium]